MLHAALLPEALWWAADDGESVATFWDCGAVGCVHTESVLAVQAACAAAFVMNKSDHHELRSLSSQWDMPGCLVSTICHPQASLKVPKLSAQDRGILL